MKTDFKEEITLDDIENFLAVHGQKGAKTLSLLSYKNEFYQAITNPLGQTLMRDLMILMEGNLNKIIDMKATDDEKAEYRSYKKLFERWSGKINEYLKLKNKVKQRS